MCSKFPYITELDKYALELLFAADKYDLSSLLKLCTKYLTDHVNEQNVAGILLAACLLRLTDLKATAIEFVVRLLNDSNNKNVRERNNLWTNVSTIMKSEFANVLEDIEKMVHH